MKYDARSMHDAGLPPFRVSGGQFASEQVMGWHVTNERGQTAAVACDPRLVLLVNEAARAQEAERERCCADLCPMCARGLPAAYGPAHDGPCSMSPFYEFWHPRPEGEEWQREARPCHASAIRLRVWKEEQDDERRRGGPVPGDGPPEG